MRAYLSFTKKEFLGNLRTYKLLIMFLVFLLFGMLGPITAKLTPKLLESLITDGITITLPEPSAFDSWAQFFKNVSQLGLFIVVILFSGMMANEYSHGTLINVLTKGLKRSTVILSKFTAASMIWTGSYLVCFLMSYFYTEYFWPEDKILNLSYSVFYLWMFGILLIALIILGGVIFRNSYGCLLFTGGFIVFLYILNIVPKIQKYNPVALISTNMALLKGESLYMDVIPSLVVSIAIIFLSIAIAIGIFNKKQI
ncbi:MAG: ABC transporter permease subunit [Clostridiaceae bacterium]